jgi:hypothetical protein
MKERKEFKVLGRIIGTCAVRLVCDLEVFVYDFNPIDSVDLPIGDVKFNFETGLATSLEDNNEKNIMLALSNLLWCK